MKIQRKKPRKKILFIVLVAALILAVLAATYYFLVLSPNQKKSANTPSKVNTVNYNPPTDAQKQEGNRIKEEGLKNQTGQTAPTPPTNPHGTVTISRVGQSTQGGAVSLRTQVDGITSGQCEIIFSLSGQPSIIKNVNVISGPTYYTCENVDISSSEFAVSGNWQVSVVIKQTNSVISNNATTTVEVKK